MVDPLLLSPALARRWLLILDVSFLSCLINSCMTNNVARMINSDYSIPFENQQFGIKIPVPYDDHGWELSFDEGCDLTYPG
jgi:hypothetical protein